MSNSSEIDEEQQLLEEEDKKEHGISYKFFIWFLQIGLWLLIILRIVLYIIESDQQKNITIVLIIYYIIYLIIEFCSPTSSYLRHKETDLTIYDTMGDIFKTPPSIQFNCECYHYKTVTTTTTVNGRTQTRTHRKKVVTHRETYDFPIYSERDVSGTFYLNCDAAYVRNKRYIKLKLKKEIDFADAISYKDYEDAKNDFCERNRGRDFYFDFNESKSIPGMRQHNLVRLTKDDPHFVKFFYFFLCTMLTYAEIYKAWINLLCCHQRFTVKKIISTRYDLNKPTYDNHIPQIDIISEQFHYQPEYYNYLNNNITVQIPTHSELESAKIYEDKIPNYQSSNDAINNPPSYTVNVASPQHQQYPPQQALPPQVAQQFQQYMPPQYQYPPQQFVPQSTVQSTQPVTQSSESVTQPPYQQSYVYYVPPPASYTYYVPSPPPPPQP